MVETMDARSLRAAGREIAFPFLVAIETADGPVNLLAERELRVLPGKRVVCAGRLLSGGDAEALSLHGEAAAGSVAETGVDVNGPADICSNGSMDATSHGDIDGDADRKGGDDSGGWEGTGRPAVVKLFLDPTGAPRHFRREAEGCRALAAAGIPTPRILLTGELEEGGGRALAFEALDPAEDLQEAWDRAGGDAARSALQRRAAEAIADQHAAGLLQRDLHLGNFLASEGTLYTIDGDAVDAGGKGAPLSRKASLENLGLFFAQFHPDQDHLVEETFAAYARRRGWNVDPQTSQALSAAIARRRERRLKKFMEKLHRECTAFACGREGGRRWVLDRAYHDSEMAAFIADPDGFMAAGRILKDGNTATVAEVRVGNRLLVAKRYNIKGTGHALRRCLRPCRARISWEGAHMLRHLGIPTARPVLLLEERRGPFPGRAWFVTEYLEGRDLWHLLHSEGRKDMDLPRLADGAETLFRQLIRARVTHGDFKGMNFLLSGGELFLIDLDAIRRHRRMPPFRRAFLRDIRRFERNWDDLPEVAPVFAERTAKVVADVEGAGAAGR